MSRRLNKILKKNRELVKDPAFQAEAERLGFPKCPKCKAPLLAGYGDSTGNYYICLSCGHSAPTEDCHLEA